MSIKYRRLDSNGDYIFGNGISDFASDAEAVVQAIKTKILLLKGEWWENLSIGTDLFQNILQQNLSNESKNAIDIIIKERILDVAGVSTIKQFDSLINRSARTYYADLIIETIYGDVEQEVNLGG